MREVSEAHFGKRRFLTVRPVSNANCEESPESPSSQRDVIRIVTRGQPGAYPYTTPEPSATAGQGTNKT